MTTRVALLATYPPRRCGIATFAADLRTALLDGADGEMNVDVIAVDREAGNPSSYPDEVTLRLAGDDTAAYGRLAEELNESADALVVQHEYGIYGGPGGRHLTVLLESVRIPVLTTMHTVVSDLDEDMREVLTALEDRSDRLIVMSPRGRRVLLDQGARPERVEVVPHGVPQVPAIAPADMRRHLGLREAPTVLSFGLLGPGKRIEDGIAAFAEVAKHVPDAQYLIVGATHPEVRRRYGESYRRRLEQLAHRLGVRDRTIFIDRYVGHDEVTSWLLACDVFVTAYGNAQQVTSGMLSHAVAAGRACVSTPYVHARELLADGRGVLVPFEDPSSMAGAIRELLEDDDARRRMGDACRAFARRMAWPVVGAAYRRILDEVIAERTTRPPVPMRPRGALPGVERRHLDRLRAPQGIWQHTVGTQPDPARGTCTDDVARALTVDVAHARARPTAQTSRAVRQDLGYLVEAFDRGTGRFRNFRSADGTWLDSPGSEDAHGRAVQALGDAAARSSDRWVRAAARRLFLEALPAGSHLAWARPRAYVLLGCASLVGDHAGDGHPDREALAALHELGEWLYQTMDECPGDWPWPEALVTYDNGVLPETLIEAGSTLGRPEWVQLGLDRLDWLLSAQIGPAGVLRPVGNQGWWPRGGRPARFDQQPIEAASLLRAAAAAWRATGDPTWRIEMRRAFGWFLGENDLGLPVAVPDTGTCHDGLGREGVSENAGAESTLAWLASVETMRDALSPLTEPARRAAGSGRRRRLHAVPRGHLAQMRQDAAEAADRDADGRIRGTVVDT